MLLVACANSEYDGRIDTVYSLDTPSVSAKAYPGVNVVSWQPVTGVKGYKVSVYEEGVFKGDISSSGNSYADTNLVNGKKYTYYVEAVSATNPGTLDLSRGVYATNSRGEASVTAIVPPAGTSALELPAYEGGYDGTAKEVKDDKFVVSAENVVISVDKENVYVNIPTKAYLLYHIYINNTNLSNEIPGILSYKDIYQDCNSNNVTLAKRFAITSSGKYKVVVKVEALGSIYKYSEVEAGEIEIEDLDLNSQTKSVSANYLSDGKTAHIEFTPAKKKKDDANVPTSWYKVYRRVQGEFETTLISGDVKEILNDRNKYYVDDEITDKTKAYEYIVVVENDGKYGEAQKATLTIKDSLDLSLKTPSAKYLDDGKTVEISFKAVKKDEVYVPTSWYKVYRRVQGEYATTLVSGDIKEAVDTDGNTYYIYDEIADTTKAYEYIVVVENDGKYNVSPVGSISAKTSLELDSDTDSVVAKYLYNVNHFATSADNTVRISFTPAKTKEDGKPVPTSWYKVYRNEKDSLDQTEITSASNKIMQDNADLDTYVIYDADKSIDPSKEYVYTVVVENDGKSGATRKVALGKATKPKISINNITPSRVNNVYNDVKWTFIVDTNNTQYGKAEDGSKVVLEAYILVIPTTQEVPSVNEIIAKGEKIIATRDTTYTFTTSYRYECSKSDLSEGNAYFVVKATYDGYEDTGYVSSSGPYPIEKDSTN